MQYFLHNAILPSKCNIDKPFLSLSLINSINSIILLSNNGINLSIISILFPALAICNTDSPSCAICKAFILNLLFLNIS
ncbi:hypothetical protein BLOT_011106 [Blomia tropicalis]|nr:hypothetical protein BLOT_011106 [Blomia tropicalis]